MATRKREVEEKEGMREAEEIAGMLEVSVERAAEIVAETGDVREFKMRVVRFKEMFKGVDVWNHAEDDVGFGVNSGEGFCMATHNIDGMRNDKLAKVLWFIITRKIDACFLQDTRIQWKTGKAMAKKIRHVLGVGTWVRVTASVCDGTARRMAGLDRGGQMIIVGTKMGRRGG